METRGTPRIQAHSDELLTDLEIEELEEIAVAVKVACGTSSCSCGCTSSTCAVASDGVNVT